jgi:hypothetical protein
MIPSRSKYVMREMNHGAKRRGSHSIFIKEWWYQLLCLEDGEYEDLPVSAYKSAIWPGF